MATLDNSVDVNQLIINVVPNKTTFLDMQANSQVNSGELYFVEGSNDAALSITINGTEYTFSTESNSVTISGVYAPTTAGTSGQILKSSGSGAPTWSTPATLTIGSYTYNGSSNVNIPVYNGEVS